MHAPRHKSSLQRRFKMASSENILREKDFRDRDQLNMRENKKTPQRKKKKKNEKNAARKFTIVGSSSIDSIRGTPLIYTFNLFSVLSIFKWNKMDKTNNKFITSQSFLLSDIIPTSLKGKESDELLLYGSVTRYGLQSVLVNLLSRTLRIFRSKIVTLSQF